MDADLYINECSFRYNGEDTSDNVIRKILLFGDMIDEIRQHKDNRMFCEKENLCDTVIFPDKRKVSDIIYNQYRDKFVNRDFVNVFMKIFNLCKQKGYTLAEIKELLEYDNSDLISAILVLNRQDDLPNNKQIISTLSGWFEFRRFYLGKYPIDSANFLSEAKKYFKNLVIHPQNKDRYLREVLNSHSQQICIGLGVLNDFFIKEWNKYSGDIFQFLSLFASRHHLDDASSQDGDERFTCIFKDDNEEKRICKLHLKMYKNDCGATNQHARIYFSPPKESEKCLYVGFICTHL